MAADYALTSLNAIRPQGAAARYQESAWRRLLVFAHPAHSSRHQSPCASSQCDLLISRLRGCRQGMQKLIATICRLSRQASGCDMDSEWNTPQDSHCASAPARLPDDVEAATTS